MECRMLLMTSTGLIKIHTKSNREIAPFEFFIPSYWCSNSCKYV